MQWAKQQCGKLDDGAKGLNNKTAGPLKTRTTHRQHERPKGNAKGQKCKGEGMNKAAGGIHVASTQLGADAVGVIPPSLASCLLVAPPACRLVVVVGSVPTPRFSSPLNVKLSSLCQNGWASYCSCLALMWGERVWALMRLSIFMCIFSTGFMSQV